MLHPCRPLFLYIIDCFCRALLTSLRDSLGFVRECACFALGQFAEHCTPDIYYYHAQVC
ncbi:hypothetical protein EON64_00195 [archaeon]|nr:MAG: hypothetical protein EON64_00195 [archaeon]